MYEVGTEELKAIHKGQKDLHARYTQILASSRSDARILRGHIYTVVQYLVPVEG